MTSPVPAPATARFDELWNRIGAALHTDAPLPSRIAEAALTATGAREATLYLKDRDAWVRAGEGAPCSTVPGELPEPLPTAVFHREGDLWLPLMAEGELHGLLRLCGVPEGAPDGAALLAFLLGAVVATNRLSKQVRDAEFELKARLLEL